MKHQKNNGQNVVNAITEQIEQANMEAPKTALELMTTAKVEFVNAKAISQVTETIEEYVKTEVFKEIAKKGNGGQIMDDVAIRHFLATGKGITKGDFQRILEAARPYGVNRSNISGHLGAFGRDKANAKSNRWVKRYKENGLYVVESLLQQSQQ